MNLQDKILSYISINGPSVPNKISKHIEKDSFFTSAHLSELKEQGKLKISFLKIGGGSPLYFLPGQESKLKDFSDYLGEKEKKVFDLLNQKKVLRDSDLVPVFRAAIRSLKDFAFSFFVNYKGKKETFWKWYLISNKEAETIVKNLLGINTKKPEQDNKEEPKIKKRETGFNILSNTFPVIDKLKRLSRCSALGKNATSKKLNK
jgi:hypothetical protein